MTKELLSFATGLWLIGSTDVIDSFNTWRTTTVTPDDRILVLTRLVDIVNAMRSDLGASDDLLAHRDMLAMVINDIDEYLGNS